MRALAALLVVPAVIALGGCAAYDTYPSSYSYTYPARTTTTYTYTYPAVVAGPSYYAPGYGYNYDADGDGVPNNSDRFPGDRFRW